jgi:hypothetical protein
LDDIEVEIIYKLFKVEIIEELFEVNDESTEAKWFGNIMH